MASCKYEQRKTSEFFDPPQHYTVIQNNAEFVMTRDIYIYKAGWCSEVLSKEMLMARSDLGFRTKRDSPYQMWIQFQLKLGANEEERSIQLHASVVRHGQLKISMCSSAVCKVRCVEWQHQHHLSAHYRCRSTGVTPEPHSLHRCSPGIHALGSSPRNSFLILENSCSSRNLTIYFQTYSTCDGSFFCINLTGLRGAWIAGQSLFLGVCDGVSGRDEHLNWWPESSR